MTFLLTSSALPKHIKLPLSFKSVSGKVPASVILLQMCHNFREVRQLHAQFVVSGLLDHPLNFGRLLQSYVTMSQIADALSVFEAIPSPDVFAYNTMIRGLIQGNCPYDSLLVYNKLLLGGFTPDNHTYTFVLKACSHLKALSEGKQVQCRIIKAGIHLDTYVHSSLIHFYANSGTMDDAERVLAEFTEENTLALNCVISGYLSSGRVEKARAMFDNIARKDAATWSAMVTGYTKNKMHAEALTVFQDMIISGARPNESVLVSSLSACANLGALDQGRWIHGYIDRTGIKMTTTIATAIIDMYSKCGSIELGYQMFQEMPHRDVVAWGAIISGFAAYGQAWKCFELLDEMVADGIHPNEVIFVGILTACSHGGYVRKGQQYFHWMVHDFGIRPTIEHYGCMVDLLGRAGMLAEADELIMSMPEEPNAVIWGSLLHACRIHNDLRRGYRAYKRLIELEPTSGDRYKLASLMFANAGEKEVAIHIRKLIRKRELETLRGSSLIEVDGNVHEFLAGDINHQEMREINNIW